MELGTIGAFEGFVESPSGDDKGQCDGYPHEFRPYGGRRRSVALGSRAARSLRLRFCGGGVENDAIGGAFGNLTYVVFDGEAQRGANALD